MADPILKRAAAAEHPTRRSRAVLGDVVPNRATRSKHTSADQEATKKAARPPPLPPRRRRSQRLSQPTDVSDGAAVASASPAASAKEPARKKKPPRRLQKALFDVDDSATPIVNHRGHGRSHGAAAVSTPFAASTSRGSSFSDETSTAAAIVDHTSATPRETPVEENTRTLGVAKRKRSDSVGIASDAAVAPPAKSVCSSYPVKDTAMASASHGSSAALPVAKRKRSNSSDNGDTLRSQAAVAAADPPKDVDAAAVAALPQLQQAGFAPQEHTNMVVVNFDPKKFTRTLSKYDRVHENNPMEASAYAADIFQRLYQQEEQCGISRYMHNQKHLTCAMRAILIDWVVEVHTKFRCVPETLFLAVNIIDRYLSKVEINHKELQLVGVTAFYVACKYEEIYPPDVKDCVYTVDRSYSKQDILDMELDILVTLEFHLTVPTGLMFLRRFLLVVKASRLMDDAANYYLERILQEHGALDFKPSVLAAAAVCLAINHPELRENDGVYHDEKPGVPDDLIQYTGFTAGMIHDTADFVARKVTETVMTQQNRSLDSVKRKFATEYFQCVSTDFESPDAVDLLP